MNMIEHIEKKPPVRIRSEDQYKSMAFLVAFPHLSHNLLDCMDLLKDPPSEKFSTDSLPPLPQVVDAWQTKIINPGISWIITQVYHGIIMVWRCFLLTSRWKRAKSTIFTEGIFFFSKARLGIKRQATIQALGISKRLQPAPRLVPGVAKLLQDHMKSTPVMGLRMIPTEFTVNGLHMQSIMCFT